MDLKKAIYSQALRLKKLRDERIESGIIFHASEAGDCKRKILLRHLNKKPTRVEEDEARVEMLFEDGRLHQAAVTSYLKQAPGIHITNIEDDRYLIIERPYMRNGLQYPFQVIISGHPDGVAHDVKKKEKWIVEVKGLSRFNPIFSKKVQDEDIEGLKNGYPIAIPQSRIYRIMFDTKGSIILVKNKDTSALVQFHIEKDKEVEERIINKFVSIAEAIREGRDDIPCDYMKGDSKCNFCPFPDQCGYGKD